MTASERSESAPTGVLSLMADIGHEVASYGFDSAGLGEVLDQEQDEPGAERRHPGGHGECLAPARAAPGKVQFDLAYLPVPARVAGHDDHWLDGQFPAAHETEGVRGRAGLDHGVGLVEYDGGGAEHGQNRVDARRQDRVGVQRGAGGAFLFPLTPAERQHGDDAGEYTGDRCRCGDSRVHVHGPRLGTVYAPVTAVRGWTRTLVAQSSPWGPGWFTSYDRAAHPSHLREEVASPRIHLGAGDGSFEGT